MKLHTKCFDADKMLENIEQPKINDPYAYKAKGWTVNRKIDPKKPQPFHAFGTSTKHFMPKKDKLVKSVVKKEQNLDMPKSPIKNDGYLKI